MADDYHISVKPLLALKVRNLKGVWSESLNPVLFFQIQHANQVLQDKADPVSNIDDEPAQQLPTGQLDRDDGSRHDSLRAMLSHPASPTNKADDACPLGCGVELRNKPASDACESSHYCLCCYLNIMSAYTVIGS